MARLNRSESPRIEEYVASGSSLDSVNARTSQPRLGNTLGILATLFALRTKDGSLLPCCPVAPKKIVAEGKGLFRILTTTGTMQWIPTSKRSPCSKSGFGQKNLSKSTAFRCDDSFSHSFGRTRCVQWAAPQTGIHRHKRKRKDLRRSTHWLAKQANECQRRINQLEPDRHSGNEIFPSTHT